MMKNPCSMPNQGTCILTSAWTNFQDIHMEVLPIRYLTSGDDDSSDGMRY